ncbi:MAG: AAA family ATPase [Geobacteraceae bacterium]|nr:AAA family ATPase [Geobacteraceae bacterium]
MYCEFYGFREKPFNITPNPRFIFLSKNHREAFAHLLYGIDNHAGFIELTGEVGTGKTTVLRTLFEQLDERGHRTALIFNPCLSALELLRSINREFAIPWEGLTSSELLDALNRFLLSENSAGRTVVLVIDEAQNLEPQVLEQVRLISNLETKTDKLIQIVLAGQPELKKLLNRPDLRQLSQRITVSYHLTPMDFEDSRAYIEHRLEVAGDWRAAVFTPRALKRVFRWSGGVPRLINIVCDRALLFGYIGESREISARMVLSAIAEIRREGRGSAGFPLRRALPWSLAAIAAIALFALLRSAPGKPAPFSPAQAGRSISGPAVAQLPLSGELGNAPETESALTAFNALMERWAVSPVSGQAALNSPRDMGQQAAQRGLMLARYHGSLYQLVQMDYPAILELTLPGGAGKRYLALTGVEQGKFLVAPPLAGRNSLSEAELGNSWSGTAWLPWKNFHNIPVTAAMGANGQEVARLQQLLQEARVYNGRITGVFGRKTAAAVRRFQEAHGLAADGKAEAQTLLLLYRAGGKFPVPALGKQGGMQQK